MLKTSLTLALAMVASALMITIWLVDKFHVPTEATPNGEQSAGAETASAALRTQAPTTSHHRVPTQTQPAVRAEFEALFARIVELGVAQKQLIAAGDSAGAHRVNEQIRIALEDLLEAYPDADGRALSRFLAIPATGQSATEQIAAIACEIVVTTGLARRQAVALRHAERAELDGLVTMLLETIGNDRERAEPISQWLVDQPFLSRGHEGLVMELVRRAATAPWLATIASALLRTLWKNLEATGLRRSEEIAALALLAKDSESPATRLAALKTLLTAADGRFRALVEQEVLQKRDSALARELASVAAIELPPQQALDLLVRLAPLAPGGMIGPFMSLGHRDPKLLMASYERMLADNVDPHVRAELVTGAGFEGGDSLEIARTAFEHDRDLEVRSRAIFVLTARAGPALGEKTLMTALDDRGLSGDPVRLSGLVIALENLAGGDPNVVDRISRRMLARSELVASDRRKLEELIARTLPGGGK